MQRYVHGLMHSHSSELPVVRRATGGGAIVHHYDWTYCIALPEKVSIGNQRPRSGINLGASQPLYDCLHDGVIEWLGTRGIAARKWSNDCPVDSPPPPVVKPHRFLCFERRSCGDIVLGDHKVMGSAQRRGRGALLQHGSLLLATSPYAPSLHGLSPPTQLTSQSLLGRFDSSDASSENLLTSFFDHLCRTLSAATEVDLLPVAELGETPCQWRWPTSTQFADPQWTHRV
ncbi:MAG: hypothetical protein KDA51_00635 [Planctomycetales bacterium]|nr:hypothetical protein [Planctomycetales bacterium]